MGEEVETVLQYAVRMNPDEDWEKCSVCGCEGDCASYDYLAKGLLLLADHTLARAAWCNTVMCRDERYSSVYLPRADVEGA